MKQTISFVIENAKGYGIGTKVKVEGVIVEIAGDAKSKKNNIGVSLEITEIDKIYEK